MNLAHKPDPGLYLEGGGGLDIRWLSNFKSNPQQWLQLLTHRRIPVQAILDAGPARLDVINTLDKNVLKLFQIRFLSFSEFQEQFSVVVLIDHAQ